MGQAFVSRRGVGVNLYKWEKRKIAQVPNMVPQKYIDEGDLTSVPEFYVTYTRDEYVSWVYFIDPAEIFTTTWGDLYAEVSNRYKGGEYVSYNGHWYHAFDIDMTGVGPIIRFNGYLDMRSRTVQNGTKDGSGAFISDVYASDANCYPQNGIKDGYWYIKR